METKINWTYEQKGTDKYLISEVVGYGEDGHPVTGSIVATVYATMETGATFDANARIIAAAPEMLEACKTMLEAWGCRAPEAGIVAIQKALAKAERR